ncbi:hypothetical protein D1007_50596 [Hordeum vulgare]|nr:hypothetical protein D1007_50596 [Hordeum vulgare]
MVMYPSHPTSSTAHPDIEVEAARTTSPLVLKTKGYQMAHLIRTIQGMEKNINYILQNHKSLERIVENKFHVLDVKVTELATTVNKLKREDVRPSISAPTATSTVPPSAPPLSTPPV